MKRKRPKVWYIIESREAGRLPAVPPIHRRATAARLLADGRATLLAVAVRYYDGDAAAAKADIYRGGA